MASSPWLPEDRAFLETLADRRDWIVVALKRFPNRSEAAVRCMMQKVRVERGTAEQDQPNAWMTDAAKGSRALLAALVEKGLRP